MALTNNQYANASDNNVLRDRRYLLDDLMSTTHNDTGAESDVTMEMNVYIIHGAPSKDALKEDSERIRSMTEGTGVDFDVIPVDISDVYDILVESSYRQRRIRYDASPEGLAAMMLVKPMHQVKDE